MASTAGIVDGVAAKKAFDSRRECCDWLNANRLMARRIGRLARLPVSMRSFRAEALSAFVGRVVENRPAEACRIYEEISDRYPIRLTRDLDQVGRWLRYQARGSERYGLLASSGA